MKLPLKIYIFALSMIVVIMPVKGQNTQVTTLLPNGKLTLRYPVMKEDKLNFDLYVHKRKLTKALQIGTITGTGYLAGSVINQTKPAFDQARIQRHIPVKVSLFSSLAALNLFSTKKPSKLMIQVDEFSANHELIKSKYIPVTKQKGNFHYSFENQASQNGYITVSMANIGRKKLNLSYTDTHITARVNNDPPIDGENNGGSGGDDWVPGGDFAAATITSHATNQVYYFYSYRGTVLNKDWNVNSEYLDSGSGGEGDHGGSGGGGQTTGEPSAEAKQLNRLFNDLSANRCEVSYVLDHLMDMPHMGSSLLINRVSVTQHMEYKGMGAANTNGASVENAYKHALLMAFNYCDLGEQHAWAMGSLHESCDGVNQNPTIAEQTMDNFNNQKGLEIAKAANKCNDRNALANSVYQAYTSGVLHDINGDQTP